MKNKPVKKNKGGRPTLYNDKIASLICEKIASSNEGLNQICEKSKDFPSPSSVYKWLSENKGFSEQYAHARERQADMLADEIIKLADECRLGRKIVTKAGKKEITEGDMVERSRLQIDARKWKASKLAPKKYGDKLDVTSDNKPLPTTTLFYLPKEDKT